MRGVTMALCALSIVASAQENPLTWSPLQVGSRWVYDHEWKSGDRNRPAVDRWSTDETVTGWATIPEGTVVLRDAKERVNPGEQGITYRIVAPNGLVRQVNQQGSSHGGYLVARSRYPYLIRGNCVYVISDGWDPQKQELRPEFRKYLSDGSVSPDFCFPLQTGREWGNNDTPWRVEPAREGVGAFLPTQYSEAIHIFSNHFGSGGSEDVWFQKGIGVVGEHYIHSGTYDEYTKKLVSFSR
jgi:hypothetical protein